MAKVRINMTLDEELHRTYQRICGKTGRTFSSVVGEMLEKGLPTFLRLEVLADKLAAEAASFGGALTAQQVEVVLAQFKAESEEIARAQLQQLEQLPLFPGEAS